MQAVSGDAASLADVDAFVLEQFKTFGPLSAHAEHCAFVYVLDGVLDQSHISARCTNPDICTINPARSMQGVPKRALIVAEWHTHPQNGARLLSSLDAQGAYSIGQQVRSHGRPYWAYYSDPHGEVYRWDTSTHDSLAANRSRVSVGGYARAAS